MARPYSIKKISKRGRALPIVIVLVAALLLIGLGVVRVIYNDNLRPVSSSTATTYFTIPSGTSLDQIARGLKQTGLIRSTAAFTSYVRTNEDADKLQAGTYVLSPSMSVQAIVKKMVSGDVDKNLLTILPGKRLDEIKQTFSKAGYSPDEINTAFNTYTYLGSPILNYLPSGASLEGFLYPDSFQRITGTPAQTIVKESLDEMYQNLTPDIIGSFKAHNLSIYQGITLASIVYQETDDPTYQSTVAQVFLSRMAQNMALQSNVTANYAADIAGVPRSTNIDSPYNTYLHQGLPPGPIGNVTKQVLNAVAHPSSTDYLYFIAGEDGKMHFSHTQDEQNQAIRQFCPTKCAQP